MDYKKMLRFTIRIYDGQAEKLVLFSAGKTAKRNSGRKNGGSLLLQEDAKQGRAIEGGSHKNRIMKRTLWWPPTRV
jgi:hypothetical protein